LFKGLVMPEIRLWVDKKFVVVDFDTKLVMGLVIVFATEKTFYLCKMGDEEKVLEVMKPLFQKSA